MSKKILWISNYHESSGWGNVSLNNIIALISAGADLVLRPLSFGGIVKDLPPKIHELQNRDICNIDVCIQHTLPTLYCYNGSFQNIGYYESETMHFYSSMWQKHINLMDKAWVPSQVSQVNSMISGVDIPISVVNHCIEWDRYQNFKPTAHIMELDGSYNFCFVGELSKRKNIIALLRAFHTEFHPSENVNLFLKLNMPGATSDQCMEKFNTQHTIVKDGLKLRQKYKEVIVVTGHESYSNIVSMMQQCHCIISTSYGESWCQPIADGLALGLNAIYTSGTGTEEFADCGASAVGSYTTNCFGAVETLPELYSGYDSWREISIPSLMFSMRNMYEQRNYQDRKMIAESVKYLDFKEVGKKMMESINEKPN